MESLIEGNVGIQAFYLVYTKDERSTECFTGLEDQFSVISPKISRRNLLFICVVFEEIFCKKYSCFGIRDRNDCVLRVMWDRGCIDLSVFEKLEMAKDIIELFISGIYLYH